MTPAMQLAITILGCGGFWTAVQVWITTRQNAKKKETDEEKAFRAAVTGLLHDRIYSLCNSYLSNQYITLSEYDNLQYLYKPYESLGGNGTAKRLMQQIEELELRNDKKETENE